MEFQEKTISGELFKNFVQTKAIKFLQKNLLILNNFCI